MGAIKPAGFQNPVARGGGFAEALFQSGAEIIPEDGVIGRVFLGAFFQLAQHAVGDGIVDFFQHGGFLQRLAADIQRQVGRVDHPAQEAQVGRHQLHPLIGDEDALHIQLHPAPALGVKQVERLDAGDEEQAGIFHRALGLVMQHGPWLLGAVGQVAVEFLVLRVGDFGFRSRPDSDGAVERVGDALDIRQGDGKTDMVGIGLDDMAELMAVDILFRIGLHMQGDGGAADGSAAGLDLVLAQPVRFPQPYFITAGLAAFNGDFIGHHEAGIEPHAELADEVDVLVVIPRQKLRGAGFGDGAEMVDQIVAVHADAGVFDADGAGFFIERDMDFQFGLVAVKPAVSERRVAQLVAGVGCIADQLAQKNIAVGIESVNHQVQHARCFGGEAAGFIGGGGGFFLGGGHWLLRCYRRI